MITYLVPIVSTVDTLCIEHMKQISGSLGVILMKAPVTKVGQNLSPVAKNINSTEHFGNLNADYLWSKGPKNNSCGIEYLSVNFSGLLQYVKPLLSRR